MLFRANERILPVVIMRYVLLLTVTKISKSTVSKDWCKWANVQLDCTAVLCTTFQLPKIKLLACNCKYIARNDAIRALHPDNWWMIFPQAEVMIAGVKDAFVRNLPKLKWMDSDTRKAAVDKVWCTFYALFVTVVNLLESGMLS